MRYVPVYQKAAFEGKRLGFMQSLLDPFKVAHAENRDTEFILDAQRKFFKRFPVSMQTNEEPTDEELAAVDDSIPDDKLLEPSKENLTEDEFKKAMELYEEQCALINFRKGQIERWLRYRIRKSAPTAEELEKKSPKDPMTLWMGQLLGLDIIKKPQKPISYNLWVQRDPKAKIREDTKLQQEKAKNDPKNRLTDRLQVRRSLFEQLPKEEQNRWGKLATEENERAMKEYKEALRMKPSMDPEEIQTCIDNFPRLIQPILDLVHEWTGWQSTIILGGPEPADRGRLNVVAMHGGRMPGPVPMNFGQAYKTQYKETIVPLFGNYLKSCFTPEKCKAVALTGFETQQYQCLREMNGEDDEGGSMTFGVIDFGPSMAERWEALRQERLAQQGKNTPPSTSSPPTLPPGPDAPSQSFARSPPPPPSQSPSAPPPVPQFPPGLPRVPLPSQSPSASPPVPQFPPGLPLPPLHSGAAASVQNSPHPRSATPPSHPSNNGDGSTGANAGHQSPSFWDGDDMFAPVQSPPRPPAASQGAPIPQTAPDGCPGSPIPSASHSRAATPPVEPSSGQSTSQTNVASALSTSPGSLTQSGPPQPDGMGPRLPHSSQVSSPLQGNNEHNKQPGKRSRTEAMLLRKKLKEIQLDASARAPTTSVESSASAGPAAQSSKSRLRKASRRVPPTRPSNASFVPSASPLPSASSASPLASNSSTTPLVPTPATSSSLAAFAKISAFEIPPTLPNTQLKRKRSILATDAATPSATSASADPKRPRPRPRPLGAAAADSTPASASSSSSTSKPKPVDYAALPPIEFSDSDPDAPRGPLFQKFEGSRVMLKAISMGKWMELVAYFQEFEKVHANVATPAKAGLGKGRKVAARPMCIGAWIGRARRVNYRPDKDGVSDLISTFPAWWQSLQPEGRTVGTQVDGSGDWSPLRVATDNGFLNVMAGLFFWGNAVKGQKEEVAKWDKMVEDAIWVVRRMTATVPAEA